MAPTAVNPLSSLADLTLSQVAAALSAGECSPVELTDDYLARIDELDPSLNAYVEVTRQRAKDDAARAADEIAKGRYRGPLHGIPIALKDLVDTAGIRTGSGPRSTGTASRRAMRPWHGGWQMAARSCSARPPPTSWRGG